MFPTSPLSARGARARSAAALLVVLAAAACDTNSSTLAPTAADNSLDGVGIFLDLPTVALALGSAGSTLHAVRPGSGGMDTVAAVWHSSDEHVVSVAGDGRLTPRGVGSTKVWARVGHDSVSSAVTVAPDGPAAQANAAGFVVKPNVAMLTVGTPQQLSASAPALSVASASASAAASAPTVKWTSSAPAVASVSSTGTVVPIAPGIAVITATANGARATSTVLVLAPRNAGSRVDVAVMRFDGGSGPVMVSNGVPFARGAVTAATLNQIHVFVNDAEQRVFTRALGGTWPDGSLRAALVQFDYNIPDARTISGYISIGGGARTLPAPAERAAVPTPVAAVLPTSSAYLISTGIASAVYDPTATRAPTTMIAQYEGDYVRLAAADWAQCGASWSCGRTAGYDRAYILYQEWVRTANPTYWQHASAIVANYIDDYLAPGRGFPAAWWANPEGTAVHYWATGDERTRGYVFSIASEMVYQTKPGLYGLGTSPGWPQYGDDRARAKTLIAMMDMRRVDAKPTSTGPVMDGDATYMANYMAGVSLADAVSEVLSTQQASGAFGGTQYKGGQKAFMVGMLLEALTRYYDEVTPDPRIPVAVKRAIDYMWQNEWVSSAQGFKYCTVVVDADNGDDPMPSLNNLIAPAYAWYYNQSGDARYAAMVDQMLAATSSSTRSWWAASGKAFDQAFYHAFNVFQWRNR